MNKNIMIALGFGDMVKCVEDGVCPFCHKEVDPEEFTSDVERREFKISGLCKACQDRIFNSPEL